MPSRVWQRIPPSPVIGQPRRHHSRTRTTAGRRFEPVRRDTASPQAGDVAGGEGGDSRPQVARRPRQLGRASGARCARRGPTARSRRRGATPTRWRPATSTRRRRRPRRCRRRPDRDRAGRPGSTPRRGRRPPRSPGSGWRRRPWARAVRPPIGASPGRAGRGSTVGRSNRRLANVTGRSPQWHRPGSTSPLVTSGGPVPVRRPRPAPARSTGHGSWRVSRALVAEHARAAAAPAPSGTPSAAGDDGGSTAPTGSAGTAAACRSLSASAHTSTWASKTGRGDHHDHVIVGLAGRPRRAPPRHRARRGPTAAARRRRARRRRGRGGRRGPGTRRRRRRRAAAVTARSAPGRRRRQLGEVRRVAEDDVEAARRATARSRASQCSIVASASAAARRALTTAFASMSAPVNDRATAERSDATGGGDEEAPVAACRVEHGHHATGTARSSDGLLDDAGRRATAASGSRPAACARRSRIAAEARPERRVRVGDRGREPVPHHRTRRVGGAARGHPADAARGRPRQAPRHQRAHRSRRGHGGVPAAVAPAQPVRQRMAGPRPGVVDVPRDDGPARPVRHRRGRQRGRRQEHVRPHPPGPPRPLARSSAGRPGHDGRVPAPQRGARRAPADGPQGLPRELRHPPPAARSCAT